MESPSAPQPPRPIGPDVIRDHVSRLPSKPGVYRMFDEAGEAIYVGKAKNLKNRVSNYVRLGGHTNRIAAMIALTASMEFTVTATETEALLLEANLIKKLRPKYNILLRDDKSFPYILIRRDHPAPQIMKHRGARSIPGDYFGPFASAGAVNRTLTTLQKAFLIRSCSDSVYENRTRPCMLHQIKRCAAPCVGLVSLEAHDALVDDAKAFLSGRSDALRKRLQAEMAEAAEALDFERAARLRDRIRALAPITTQQDIRADGLEEADVIGLHAEGGQTCVHVIFFRAGQNWGDRSVFPRHEADASPEDVLAAFIGQFYEDKPVPRLILASHVPTEAELLAEAMALRAERKVEIAIPQRGDKTRLVDHAVTNAREALSRRMAETSAQGKLLASVAEAFDLDAPPRRIEVYDNSHIQGSNAVGAMIVAGPEGLSKRDYRTWNLKAADLTPGDDYAMMREVLGRRFARLIKAKTSSPPGLVDGDSESETGDGGARPETWPDLVLIDGGPGQLAAAVETIEALGLTCRDVVLVGVAKGEDRDAGRETFYRPGRGPLKLPPNDPALYFLQRLRDEAHRFAIGAHRAKRSKAIAANPLDDIPGVGPARKKALLAHFGSARAIRRAALEDLEKVDGVSKAMARKVYEWFNA